MCYHSRVCFNNFVTFCARSLMDRTKASDAFNAGSIPVGRTDLGSYICFRDINRKSFL